MVSLLRVVIVCSVLLAGCSTDSTESVSTAATPIPSGSESSTSAGPAAETTSSTTQPAAQTTTPAAAVTTTASAGTVTEAEVHAALTAYLPVAMAETNFGGEPFCGHYLHGLEQEGDHVSAYISGWCHEYYIEEGHMEMGSAAGITARVDILVTADGPAAYAHDQALSEEEGGDELFPQWVINAMRNQRVPIVPGEPLIQAATYFGAVPHRTLPSGASCAEVESANPLYVFAVMYWLRDGRPAALDSDGDGRPCEDQYATHLVDMYWTPMSIPLESGFLCRDLDGYGVSVEAAVGYWLAEGRPNRMDADGDGVPCETVYDEEFDDFFSAVLDEAPDQFCRELAASGYRFSDAVAYWLLEGSPDRMDADGDGIPCETVYDPMEVGIYLSTGVREIDSGLFCRDLIGTYAGFAGAVEYWMHEGMPDRMDADGDGIPCETVYDQFEIDRWIEFDRVWQADGSD